MRGEFMKILLYNIRKLEESVEVLKKRIDELEERIMIIEKRIYDLAGNQNRRMFYEDC